MRTTEMVLFAHFLKTSKFIPVCTSIYILSLGTNHLSRGSNSLNSASKKIKILIIIVNTLNYTVEGSQFYAT